MKYRIDRSRLDKALREGRLGQTDEKALVISTRPDGTKVVLTIRRLGQHYCLELSDTMLPAAESVLRGFSLLRDALCAADDYAEGMQNA